MALNLPALIQKVRVETDTAAGEAQVASSFSRMGGAMTKVGKGLSVALTLPVIAFGVSSVKAASDFHESLTKAQQVFGPLTKSIVDFAKTGADAFGLSTGKALEALGTFGNLFTAMGLGRPKAADLSKGLVQLAGDLASFNNTSVDEALTALQAGMVGQIRPLRRFGVQLSATRVDAEAFRLGLVKMAKDAPGVVKSQIDLEKAVKNLGIAEKQHGKDSVEARDARNKVALAEEAVGAAMKKSGGEITSAAKAQARYSLIMKDTTTAHNDYARTLGGSLANQQKQAIARFENTKEVVGSVLLPVMIKAMGIISAMAGAFDKLGGGTQTVIVTLLAVGAALGPLLLIGGKLISSGQAIGSALVAVGNAGVATVNGIGRLASGFTSAEAAGSAFSGKLGTIGGLLRSGVEGFASLVAGVAKAAVSIVVEGAKMVASFVATAASAVAEAAVTAGAWLLAAAPFIAIGIAVAAVTILIIKNWDTIAAATSAVWGAITSFFAAWWPALLVVMTGGLGAIALVIANNWSTITGITSAAWNAIRVVIETVVNAIRAVIGVVFGAIAVLFQTQMAAWQAVTGAAWAAITGVIRVAAEAIRVVVSTVFAAIGGVFAAAHAAWSAATSAGWGAIRGVFSASAGAIQGVVSAMTGAISGIWGALWPHLAGAVGAGFGAILGALNGAMGGVLGFFRSLGVQMINSVGDIAGRFFSLGQSIIQGLLNGVRSLAGSIADAVLGPIKSAVDAAKRFLHIGSPSRLFFNMGENVMLGYIQGLQEHGKPLDKTMVDLLRPPSLTVPAVARHAQATAVLPGSTAATAGGGPGWKGPLIGQQVVHGLSVEDVDRANRKAFDRAVVNWGLE